MFLCRRSGSFVRAARCRWRVFESLISSEANGDAPLLVHRAVSGELQRQQALVDRGKVMTAAELDAGKNFGRYLDVDGDGIPFRTYPGTHPTRGSFFTRGTTKDEYARYSEEGAVYVRNMERLQKKFDTARKVAPQPLRYSAPKPTRYGVIYFGSTSPAMDEALDHL